VARVKRLRHGTLDQASQVGGRLETVGGMYGHELLILDLVVVESPAMATTVARITPLFDVDQQFSPRSRFRSSA
jgi:hypothetical protein